MHWHWMVQQIFRIKPLLNNGRRAQFWTICMRSIRSHPGILHYIIHSYDYPELAELGLNAARKYASIAPSSSHAQHMPSHIFTRLGLWDEESSQIQHRQLQQNAMLKLQGSKVIGMKNCMRWIT